LAGCCNGFVQPGT